jgi:hypothetical protein
MKQPAERWSCGVNKNPSMRKGRTLHEQGLGNAIEFFKRKIIYITPENYTNRCPASLPLPPPIK